MRKLLVALCLAFLMAPALAAPVCIPGFYGITLDVGVPKRSDAGWRVVWVCRDSAGQPKGQWLTCVHGTCEEQIFRDAIYNATRAEDPVTSIKGAWDTRVAGTSCTAATGALKTVCDEAMAESGQMVTAYLARPPVAGTVTPAPTAEVWKVSTNGSYTTRPTYTWANGVRGTVATAERAPVGSACNPAVGKDSYRGVLGRTDRVALCKKQ